MGEMNERDLERVAGGAGNGVEFNSLTWDRENCRKCGKNLDACSDNMRVNAMIQASRQAALGLDTACPDKI